MKRSIHAAVCAAGIAATTLLLTPSAEAFSTGNHFTITDRALRKLGFGGEAIIITQSANYEVDFVANIPDAALEVLDYLIDLPDVVTLQSIDKPHRLQVAKNISHFFHFDALGYPVSVEREFAWHDAATRKMVQWANGDPSKLLLILGIESHAIQDFYAHSMFADVDWLGWTGTAGPVYEDVHKDLLESTGLQTRFTHPAVDPFGLFTEKPSQPPYEVGSDRVPGHGDGSTYCGVDYRTCGTNHDGVRRRNSLRAMTEATDATVALVNRMHTYIGNEATYNAMKSIAVDPGARQAWDRAQATSIAQGQWGYNNGASNVDTVLAIHATQCSNCPQNQFDARWGRVLFGLFDAAIPGIARGGSASPYPSNATPTFPYNPTPSVPAPSTLVGTYAIDWCGVSGSLQLTSRSTLETPGMLIVPGGQHAVLNVIARGDGYDITLAAPGVPTGIYSGRIYPYGSGNVRGLTGFIRHGPAHIPEAFQARAMPAATVPTNTTAVQKR